MNAKPMKKTVKPTKGKTNWVTVKHLTEKQIKKSAQSDLDAPLLTPAELKKFKRVHSPKTVNVRRIRQKLDLSQEEFAVYFGVNKRTVQEWEQGRRHPASTARNFLRVIECEPRAVQRALSPAKNEGSSGSYDTELEGQPKKKKRA